MEGFYAISLMYIVMLLVMSGCTRAQTKADQTEDLRFNIVVEAETDCRIEFNVDGTDYDVTTGDTQELHPQELMEK